MNDKYYAWSFSIFKITFKSLSLKNKNFIVLFSLYLLII